MYVCNLGVYGTCNIGALKIFQHAGEYIYLFKRAKLSNPIFQDIFTDFWFIFKIKSGNPLWPLEWKSQFFQAFESARKSIANSYFLQRMS